MSNSETETTAQALKAEARAHAQAGRAEAAAHAYAGVLERAPDDAEAHAFAADMAFAGQRFAEAANHYRKALAAAPETASLWFNCATAQEALGETAHAAASYLEAFRREPNNPMMALFAGAALDAAGRSDEALQVWSLGDDLGWAVRKAKDVADFPPEVRTRSARADEAMRRHFTELHAKAVTDAEAAWRAQTDAPAALERVRNAVWPQTHTEEVRFRASKHAPLIYYMPDLAPVTIASRADFSWVETLEQATATIREEFLAAEDARARMTPYIRESETAPIFDKLRGSRDWSSLPLFGNGEPTQWTEHFPRTLAVLDELDLTLVDGAPMQVLFSVLHPGTHIPPHTGQANDRFVAHLPLIVPGDCAIRVADQTHVWSEGEAFIFDDTFEHEAWNRSEAVRVNMIFLVNRHDMTEAEKFATAFVRKARENWLDARKLAAAE